MATLSLATLSLRTTLALKHLLQDGSPDRFDERLAKLDLAEQDEEPPSA